MRFKVIFESYEKLAGRERKLKLRVTIEAPAGFRKFGLDALLLYGLVSVAFFGRGLAGHLSDRYIGTGIDPGAMIWFLEWWHYAILHGVNPFHTHLVWAPSGYNLTAATFIPLFGVMAFPVTHFLGPTAAYNILMLCSPALAAWAAFLLCRHLRLSSLPSLMGGYVFGFSPFMLSHMLGHTSLVTVLFVPLAVLVALRWLEGSLRSGRFMLLMSIILTGQALCSLEVLATGTMLGGIALAIAFGMGCSGIQRRFFDAIAVFACSYAVVAVLLSPYLYYFFAFGTPALPHGYESIVAQPLNMIIPPVTTLLGRVHALSDFCRGANIYEVGEFVGAPILAILLSFTRTRRAERSARFLVYVLLVTWVLSFGNSLLVGHRSTIAMPWRLLSLLPLFNNVLTERLCLFGFLVLAIIVGLWLNDSTRSASLRVVMGVLVLVGFLPNPATEFWTKPVDAPAFFTTGEYMHYLSPNDNVVVLPYCFRSNSDMWQANTRMYFRMAGGYMGWAPAVPADFQNFPIVPALEQLAAIPDPALQLKVFIARNDIRALIVADQGKRLIDSPKGLTGFNLREFNSRERSQLGDLLATLGVDPIRVGGVSLYKIPLERFTQYRTIDPRELENRFARDRLNALLNAAQLYMASNYELSQLSPLRAQESGLLPVDWVTTHSAKEHLANGLLLMSMGPGDIALVILAPKPVLQDLVREYTRHADKVTLIPPSSVGRDPLQSCDWLAVLEYKGSQLADAVAEAGKRSSGS